jgi:cytochrome c2
MRSSRELGVGIPVRTLAINLVRLAICSWMALSSLPAHAAFDPAAVFEGNCGSCHSVGHGVVVGPDLRGVTGRHDTRWLYAFIRSSQAVIHSGDQSAVALYKQYQKVMPDHAYSDAEIDTLLAFIQGGGPKARGEQIRDARSATPSEIERGRDLFLGNVTFARGGAACVDCHTAGTAQRFGGGSLASDLSRVYARYQDWGLHRALRQADFPLMRRIYADKPLNEDEVFAVKAFLQHAPSDPRPPQEHLPFPMAFLGLGSSALVLLTVRRGPRRADSFDRE